MNVNPLTPSIARLVTKSQNWRVVKTKQKFSSGQHEITVKIISAPSTSNSWKWSIGKGSVFFLCKWVVTLTPFSPPST